MGTVEEQAARHAEACRRANPAREIPEGEPGHDIINRPAGFGVGPNTMSSGDTWSSGGAMPGVETPDLQGPTKPLTSPTMRAADSLRGITTRKTSFEAGGVRWRNAIWLRVSLLTCSKCAATALCSRRT